MTTLGLLHHEVQVCALKKSLERYSAFGELASIAVALESRSITLKEVSAQVGVSVETVRQDLIKAIGSSSYSAIMAARKLPSVPLFRPVSLADAASSLRIESKKSRNREQTAMATLLNLILAQGIPLQPELTRQGTLKFRIGSDHVRFRIGFPSPNHAEYPLGLYRYKLCPSEPNDILVFAMFTPKGPIRTLACYLFRTSELGQVRSLNLRFARFGRRFKWEFARDRWSLLHDTEQVSQPQSTNDEGIQR